MIEEEVADFKEKLERFKNLPNPTCKPRPFNQPKKNDPSEEEDEDVQENDPVNEGLENFQNLYNVNPTTESSPLNQIKESYCAEESDEPERPPTKPARHDELFGKAFSISKEKYKSSVEYLKKIPKMLVSPAKGLTIDDVQENEPVKPARHDTPLVPSHKLLPPEPPVPLPRKPRITDAELQESKSSMIRHVINDSEEKDREIRKLKRDNFEKDQIISMMETEIGILYEQIKHMKNENKQARKNNLHELIKNAIKNEFQSQDSRTNQLEAEKDDLELLVSCKICLTNNVNATLGCGHAFCFQCLKKLPKKLVFPAKRLTTCPVCSKCSLIFRLYL